MAAPTVRDIIAQIRSDKLAPVYILMGEEAYYIDLLMSHFEKNVIAPDDRDFNLNVFYGNDADYDVVLASVRQFPVLAPRKLVLLKEAQTAFQAKSQLEKFAAYVENPSKSNVLVIAFKGESLNATSKLLKAAKDSDAVVFTSDAVKPWTLAAHLKDFCAMRKVSVEAKAIDLLCEYIGAPLSKLFGEVDKLIQILGGEGARITCDVIEKNIGISKEFNNFELTKALASKRYTDAVRIISYFEKNPKSNPTEMTAATLFNFFSRLVMAFYCEDKSDAGLMKALGLRSNPALREVKDAMRNYSAAKAVACVHYIREFDAMSKGVGSYQNKYALLKELIFKLFT